MKLSMDSMMPHITCMTVKDSLLSLKFKQQTIDKSLFYYNDSNTDLPLLSIIHVDDSLYSGTEKFNSHALTMHDF